MAEFAPLFPLETQFQAKDGRNNTAGWLKVFLAGTDDPAVTYSDYNGTRNPEKIVLDNNGRAIIICDKEQGYRLEVYDARGMLLWTEEPVFCSGTGGAGMAITEIVSTDGSIDVQKNTAGGITQYDIGLAPSDSPEFLEWSTVYKNNLTSGGAVVPVYQAGTMSVNEYGVKVYADRFYHITNRFMVKPKGTGLNYDTFEVSVMFRRSNGNASNITYDKQNIDSSLSDSVDVEFSFDFQPTEDGELYWLFNSSCLAKFNGVDATMQVHRIYSGINAVPDTCATKQWVSSNYIPQSASGDFQAKSGMSAYVPYSAVEGSAGTISGINGSAISGMVDTSMVIPFSALEYNSSGEISGISGSAIGGQVDSSQFMPASAESSMIAYSALEYSGGQITGISGSSIGYGVDPSQFLPASASGDFYPMTGNPSGFLTAHQDISDKLDVSAFTSYSANLDSALGDEFDGIHSALDDKMDASASGDYYPMSGNPSGFLTNADISSKLDVSAFNDYSANVDSALDDKLDVTAYDSAKYPSVYWPYGLAQTTGQLLLQESRYPKYVQALVSGTGETASAGIIPPTPSSNLTSVRVLAAASGSLPDVSWMDYEPGYSTSNPSGFATTAYVDSSVSGKQDTISYGWDASGNISAIDGSAIAGQDEAIVTATASGEYYDYRSGWLGYYTGISGINNSALVSNFATVSTWARYDSKRRELSSLATEEYVDSSVSGKADASALSGYQPTGDYAYNSALSSKLDESAFSTVSGTFLTSVSLPITGAEGVETAVYGIHSLEIRRNETEGEPDIRSAYLSPEWLVIQSTYDGIDTTSVSVSENGISFSEPGRWGTVDIDSISSWNSVYGTVMNNSASWSASGVDSATVSAIASSYAESAASSKLDSSASSDFYLTSNPSGFITGVDLSNYATTSYVDSSISGKQDISGMTAYQPSGDYIYVSALGWAEV